VATEVNGLRVMAGTWQSPCRVLISAGVVSYVV
jgi:hypothetical protein